MGKANLHDIKKSNRKLIIQSVLEKKNLSRIEISQLTGLSPSTITTLVLELMDEGVLAETGAEYFTGGRRRKELVLNANYGFIAVVEIGLDGASLHLFDMLLDEMASYKLSREYLTGNQLLIEITAAIFEFFNKNIQRTQEVYQNGLVGIGLLFQDNYNENHFNVVYSTSHSSDFITLKNALFTQFKVPVIEERSQGYTISAILDATAEIKNARNCAHISIANHVLASIAINGKPLPMKDGKAADLTAFMGDCDNALAQSADNAQDTLPPMNSRTPLIRKTAELIALLCSMFPIDTIFLSDSRVKARGFLQAVKEALALMMTHEKPPEIELVELPQDTLANRLAAGVRRNVLYSG